jgi:hypothetical protein
MRRKKSTPSLAQHGLAVNLVLLAILAMFMAVCVVGAVGGLDAVSRHQPVDLMAPAWFVASGLGIIVIGMITIALLVDMIGDALGRKGSARRRR